MGIYRYNLSAMIYHRLPLSFKIIWIYCRYRLICYIQDVQKVSPDFVFITIVSLLLL